MEAIHLPKRLPERFCGSVRKFSNSLRSGGLIEINPEIETKEQNMRRTKISEYSNAIHNKGVIFWFDSRYLLILVF